jgi:hypothetical protein
VEKQSKNSCVGTRGHLLIVWFWCFFFPNGNRCCATVLQAAAKASKDVTRLDKIILAEKQHGEKHGGKLVLYLTTVTGIAQTKHDCLTMRKIMQRLRVPCVHMSSCGAVFGRMPAVLGLAWLGLAWPGLAWPGLAWLGGLVLVRVCLYANGAARHELAPFVVATDPNQCFAF